MKQQRMQMMHPGHHQQETQLQKMLLVEMVLTTKKMYQLMQRVTVLKVQSLAQKRQRREKMAKRMPQKEVRERERRRLEKRKATQRRRTEQKTKNLKVGKLVKINQEIIKNNPKSINEKTSK